MASPRAFFDDVPNELLVVCVDGSLRTCMRLAATSFKLKARLSLSAHDGLRLACQNITQARRIERRLFGYTINELIITGDWPFSRRDSVAVLLQDCPMLRIVRVDPKFATSVKAMYNNPEHGKGTGVSIHELKAEGRFEIVARPIIQKLRSPQLQLTEMEWLIR
jgi:hypothetical protein